MLHAKGEEEEEAPARTTDSLRRRRPKWLGWQYMHYSPSRRSNLKIIRRRAKNSVPQKECTPAPSSSTSTNPPPPPPPDSVSPNLRRLTRKRRISVNLEGCTDSSGSEDNGVMRPKYLIKGVQSPLREGLGPHREGLRPRCSKVGVEDKQLLFESNDEEDTSEDNVDQTRRLNRNNMEEHEANGEDEDEDEDRSEGDGDDEGEGEGEGEDDSEEDGDDDEGKDDNEEDGDDDKGDKVQEGRRRYNLRNRSDVCRLSPEESKQRPRSPQRVLRQGVGTKLGRDERRGGSRVHKRHRLSRADDSDDFLLVDEVDQGSPVPWGGGGNISGPPLLSGGLDMHGTAAWGLNAAASGWGHQGDTLSNLTSGVQTAGPSFKGGADIQPLKIDESVSFDEIGGLSEYIDALKEMVFFPLLYPDFFTSYHITPPRGVLLCGPPGTGKTLIARALACAASKAGQKVSFYMRKGADVLSKWVGEAERQLKLLFEEAQRNQPSIIFFDEIDGLAPVRSSKQEQIHNSIVSTLLALMDGLDSRGQVVLIGATNRIDAIDGALRRPGRFDREFTFPLPGCDARAEILDIHTRKWKRPPTKELRLELAANCVGYCGADLKALCTEAAIHAFREKYPQVYSSNDKFLIDVDSVEVEKYHFTESMSTITPAAHRGSLVHSRPLSSVVAPCLRKHLQKAMSIVSDIFPVVVSPELTKFSMLTYGSAIPLVYRPRFLLYGGDGSGLDHLGPAILHELEKFPVHSLGLSSLLSDPSAKTPEEALVHIFGEARRTTPSILYLPQFHLWWENAHNQLKAVLLILLAELPSDSTILLLGTSSFPFRELDENQSSVFPLCNVYHMEKPSSEDRSAFFDQLIIAALSIPSNGLATKIPDSVSLPELPKAPKMATGPKASELKAKAEVESHALRRLRMCLRDICNWILYDKRFSSFHYPISDEDEPNYRSIIQVPMDMATLLQHVDSGKYSTCKAFLEDFDLILANAKRYNADDYKGSRIISRAHELQDAVHGMLSQMDPALVASCEKIDAERGPPSVPDDLGGFSFQHAPVVQIAAVTGGSLRLRNLQPEVNLDQSYEALKRKKKNADRALAASTVEDGQQQPQEPELLNIPNQRVGSSPADCIQIDAPSNVAGGSKPHDVTMSDTEERSSKSELAKQLFVEGTKGYGIPQLERLYTRIMMGVFETKYPERRNNLNPSCVSSFLLKFAEDGANF